MDIVRNQLYFTKLIHVLHGHIHDRFHPSYTNGRRSDAFVYILEGSCRYTFDTGRDFTVNQGDILYLSHHSVYTMRIQTLDYEYIYCDFEFDGSSPADSDFYTPKNSAAVEERFRRLLHHFRHPTDTSACQCMAELYGIYALVRQSANAEYLPRSSRERIERAQAYMLANLHDPELSVAKLAENAEMSQVHFRNLFYATFGITPAHSISAARITRAKKLMIDYPFLTLEDCALQSGFTTVQYFNRCFKKATGFTPAAYRREVTGK